MAGGGLIPVRHASCTPHSRFARRANFSFSVFKRHPRAWQHLSLQSAYTCCICSVSSMASSDGGVEGVALLPEEFALRAGRGVVFSKRSTLHHWFYFMGRSSQERTTWLQWSQKKASRWWVGCTPLRQLLAAAVGDQAHSGAKTLHVVLFLLQQRFGVQQWAWIRFSCPRSLKRAYR
jgi:hypothetical protein